jgi:hypothetical protein
MDVVLSGSLYLRKNHSSSEKSISHRSSSDFPLPNRARIKNMNARKIRKKGMINVA